ncbi:MAG: TonB-dependent receptor [Bacteroidia bacterium]|nr:TonB-dependent receptor [Bacteroidia bacterium]
MFLFAQEPSDTLKEYEIDTVRIEGIQTPIATIGETSPSRLSRLLPTTQLVYRSVPFAQEVVYQGLLPQQTQVTIEGMRIVPACVDRMDPILTFVEISVMEGATWQNLQSWGNTPTLSVNLISPGGEGGGTATLLLGDNYHRVFLSALHRHHVGRLSSVSAITYRGGETYRTGKGFTPGLSYEGPAWGRDSSFHVPPFQKINCYSALRCTLSENHYVEASYLGDYFYNVAYPGLIMDARHSAMHLLSLKHNWKNSSELRLYANTVFHDMTDENRPEQEIRNRIVMPGMYMPMRGLTRTMGAVHTLTWAYRKHIQIDHHSEYSYSQATASMDMQPLNGGASMRLLNLADIELNQGGSTLSASYQLPTWVMTVQGSLYMLTYRVGNSADFLPLQLYQENYAGGSTPKRHFLLTQLGGSFTWKPTEHTLRLSIRYGQRAPTHQELYAYYLYVPMDNSILMGNSLLRPEKLLRTELLYTFLQGRWNLQITTFANWLSDYITPVTFLFPGTSANATRQQWRILKNTGNAVTAGFTAQGGAHLSSTLLGEAWIGYTYGWHQTLREPLPWIYPLFTRLRLTHSYKRHRANIEIYAAAAQKRLSRTIYIEDYTPAYALLHLRYGYQLLERRLAKSPRPGLTLTVSIENLLNTYGWDHLSVGNMPFLGRILRMGIWANW